MSANHSQESSAPKHASLRAVVHTFNPTLLRDYLLEVVKQQLQTSLYTNTPPTSPAKTLGLTHLPQDPAFLHHYYYAYGLVDTLLSDLLSDLDCIGPDDTRPVFNHLVEHDLNLVPLPTALLSWLTIDNLDLRTLDPHCPEHLSYGLVLEYREPVVMFAAFTIGYTAIEHYHTSLSLPTYGDLEHRCAAFAQAVFNVLSPEHKAQVSEQVGQLLETLAK